MTTVILGVWTIVAVALCVANRRARRATPRVTAPAPSRHPTDVAWLADQPVDCVTRPEIDRRLAHLAAVSRLSDDVIDMEFQGITAGLER